MSFVVPEKKRSITPDSEIESDGRSISPPPKKKSRSSKSSSKREKRPHRPRDENGKRIKSSKSTQLSSRSPSPLPQTPGQLQASLDLQESLKAEEVQRIKEKELNLIKLKERYEIRREKEGQDGDRMNYKGRGSMKAPSRNGSGGMRGFD